MNSCESQIAENALRDWAGEPLEAGHRAIQDTFALGVAGMFQEPAFLASRSVADIAAADGGVQPWAARRSYDVASAAFVLGTSCHCLDWDDFMHPMHGHCSAVLLPTAWALVEAVGGGGRALLDAFMAGYHVDYLVSLVLSHSHYYRGWHATSTIGTIGAAATASRVFGLSTEQTSAALGIAASLAGGLRTNFGTTTKPFHAGMAARHGVQAAQLARAGAMASRTWLTGPAGMLLVMSGDAQPDRAVQLVADAIDRGVHGIETPWGQVQKPYACCGSCHGGIDATIGLVTDHGITGADIESIELHVDPVVPTIMRETVPTDTYSARYSLSWTTAVAALDRAAGPEQFSAAALSRDDLRELRSRIQVCPDLETTAEDRFAARVVIATRDGRRLERTVSHASGHPVNPMSDAQRKSKQVTALSSVMSVADAESLTQMLARIDDIEDLGHVSSAVRSRIR